MTDAQRHNQNLATEGLSRAVKLIGSDEFAWFIGKCVVEEMVRLDGIIHSRMTGAEEREWTLAEWHALDRVRTWVQKFANDCGKSLGHEHRIVLDNYDPMSHTKTNQTHP